MAAQERGMFIWALEERPAFSDPKQIQSAVDISQNQCKKTLIFNN
jgi:hypothetical protein